MLYVDHNGIDPVNTVNTVNIIPLTKPDTDIQALKTRLDNTFADFNKAIESGDKEANKTIYEEAKKIYDDACIFAFIQKIKDISGDIIKDNDSKDNIEFFFFKNIFESL